METRQHWNGPIDVLSHSNNVSIKRVSWISVDQPITTINGTTNDLDSPDPLHSAMSTPTTRVEVASSLSTLVFGSFHTSLQTLTHFDQLMVSERQRDSTSKTDSLRVSSLYYTVGR